MKKFQTIRLAATVLAVAWVMTGCQTMAPAASEPTEGSAQTETTVQAEPVQTEGLAAEQVQNHSSIDTICVVRHPNAMLSAENVTQAIEAGLQQLGVKTRVVDRNPIPAECRLCLYYNVTMEDGKAKSFDFQAVIDGRALPKGQGPVPEDGSIPLQTVAGYAANYLQSLINAGQQKQAQNQARQESGE